MSKPLTQQEQLNALIGATHNAGWKTPTTHPENGIVTFYPPEGKPIPFNPVKTNNGRGIRQLARQLDQHGIDTAAALQQAVRLPSETEDDGYTMINYGSLDGRMALAKITAGQRGDNFDAASIFLAVELALGFIVDHQHCSAATPDIDKVIDDLAREHDEQIAALNGQHRDALSEIRAEVEKAREAFSVEHAEAKKRHDALIKEYNKLRDTIDACRQAFADEPAWKLLATVGALLEVPS